MVLCCAGALCVEKIDGSQAARGSVVVPILKWR